MSLLPGLKTLYMRRASHSKIHGLIALRTVFMSYVTGLVGVAVVVGIITATSRFTDHPLPGVPVAIAIIVLAILSLEGGRRIERPLDCTDDARLAASYRTRFFLRAAFSEAIALVGFVAVILTNESWPYPLAVAFTAVGFWRLAPTRANLGKDQTTLDESGCRRSLITVLAGTPPSG